MTDTRAPSALERAARVLADELGPGWDNIFTDKGAYRTALGMKDGVFHDINEPRQDDYLDAMRAALEALRENVTEEMMIAGIIAYADAMKPAVDMLTEAGEHTASQMLRALSGDDFRAVFHAMIAALLTEGQKEPGQ